MRDSEQGFPIIRASVAGTICLLILIVATMVGCPQYNVYSKQLQGKADYGRAVQDRRIKVLEAQAELDSATLKANAEVARAKGTNEANKIMSQSLGGPDNYLRWSYIHMLEETAGQGDRQIIYLPTEAGMPVLEAGRRTGSPAVTAP